MAITPKDNEAFYREVDEELRRDQLTSYWQRHGKLLLAGVVILLLAVAGFLWWQHHREVEAGVRAETLNAIFDDLQAGKQNGLAPRLDKLAKEGGDGYRAAALLLKADIAVEKGDEKAAVAGYKAVVDDEGLAQPYRDLALVRGTATEFDHLAPDIVIQRLKPLAVPGNPWFGSAGEMVATAYLAQHKPDQAASIFAALAKDKNVPETIRSRAVQMAGSLGIDAIQDPPRDAAGAAKEVTR